MKNLNHLYLRNENMYQIVEKTKDERIVVIEEAK